MDKEFQGNQAEEIIPHSRLTAGYSVGLDILINPR